MPEFIVEKETSLQNFIKERSFGMGYSRYVSYIKDKKIRVNGIHPKSTDKVKKDDVVSIFFDLKKPIVPIVYNDNELLIVNKPQGLPSEGNYFYTANSVILEKFPTATLCHRLDTGTSGLLMFALTTSVYKYILEEQSKNGYDKYYRAVVIGSLRDTEMVFLTHHLKKNSIESRVKIYDNPVHGSQLSKLGYRLISGYNSLSLLEVQLFTGRTHQIRAQLDHIGLPILGDDKYGNRKKNKYYKMAWPLLHAYKLDFKKLKGDYPFCGKVITLDEPEYFMKVF